MKNVAHAWYSRTKVRNIVRSFRPDPYDWWSTRMGCRWLDIKFQLPIFHQFRKELNLLTSLNRKFGISQWTNACITTQHVLTGSYSQLWTTDVKSRVWTFVDIDTAWGVIGIIFITGRTIYRCYRARPNKCKSVRIRWFIRGKPDFKTGR